MQNRKLCWALSIAFCALVFFFALHAKTAVYNGGTTASLTPSTASKLWRSGQSVEAQSVAAGYGVLLWMAVFCLFEPRLRREAPLCSVHLTPFHGNLPLRHLHRFLRPPPVLA
jgi:hypothetical protein